MAILVIAEHDNRALKPATLNAVAAATEIAAPEVDILVAGKDCRAVAEAAAKIAGARKVLGTVLRIPRADLVFALDDSRTTLLLSLLVRGKRKTGWVQGLSRLYAEDGFITWKSVRPWVSALVKVFYRPGRIRLPEDKHDAEVELELLDIEGRGQPLAAYRSAYAAPAHIASANRELRPFWSAAACRCLRSGGPALRDRRFCRCR